MIRSFVEMMLGEFGRQILYFYEANAWLFNSLILVYGLFMLLAWNNLVRCYRYLVIEVAKQIHLSDDVGRKSTTKQVGSAVEVPWEQAADVSPFPFVARIGAVLPKRITAESLQGYFDEKDIIQHAVEMLKGENIRRISPSVRKIINKEMADKKEKARS